MFISKLFHVGIRGLPFELFKSYSSNRKQQKNFCGKLSTTRFIKHGVLQGSTLGPLLLLVFINDFPNSLNHANVVMYAEIVIHRKKLKNVSKLYSTRNY